jgi:hypothetical protein
MITKQNQATVDKMRQAEALLWEAQRELMQNGTPGTGSWLYDEMGGLSRTIDRIAWKLDIPS